MAYVVDASSDAGAARLLQSCAVDPVAAQQQAQRLYDGEVDWGLAEWSNPLLKQLAQLSPLSNHDMPHLAHLRRQLRRELPKTHGLVAASTSGLSAAAEAQPFVPDLELQHPGSCAAAAASPMAQVYGVPTVSNPAPEDSARKLNLKTPSVAAPVAPSMVGNLTALLHLSSETVGSDPQLAELVRAVAERNQKTNPVAAQLMHDAGHVELPSEAWRAQRLAAERVVSEGRGRNAPSVVSPNRAFFASDVVGYAALAERGEPTPPSMHETPGYEPWGAKAIDMGARDEDEDAFLEYREALTGAQGRLFAVEERTVKRAEAERASRILAIGGGATTS